MSKGSAQRPCDPAKFAAGWDRVFGTPQEGEFPVRSAIHGVISENRDNLLFSIFTTNPSRHNRQGQVFTQSVKLGTESDHDAISRLLRNMLASVEDEWESNA